MKILFNKIPLHPPFPKWDLKYSPLWQRGVRGDFKKFPLFHSIFRAKLRNGFTLIEVIVVVAILFILSGAMIPFVYRVWESQEIDTTKERMSDLKKAMVGDPRLIQNGVRTHFGYVGDNGQLPALITDLVPSYMPAGYDPNKYNKDAWDNEFVYTIVATDAKGRRVSATLKSAGPDRILGGSSTDDFDEDIAHKNYTPDASITVGEGMSNEIDTTKERMSDLKIAMVGDPRLIQNGVRTNFGYVGDNEQLPDNGPLPGSISDALLPYMPAGYDPNKYNIDAWGNEFVYTIVATDAKDRRVSATLKSAGPDGILGGSSTDDFDEDIAHKNYTPDASITVGEGMSNEIDTTKERISDLKIAMVGDPRLIQNGVRTSYGFMGDCGQLPRATAHPSFSGQTTISDDLPNPGVGLYPSTCTHNYMPSGYDPNNYKKDAWGNEFVYTPYLATDGSDRRGSAILKSAGPDRQFGTPDDITDTTDPNLQIYEKEVIPTATIRGNFVIFNSTLDPVVLNPYSARIYAKYQGTIGETTTNTGCIQINDSIIPNETKLIPFNPTDFGVKLPIGMVKFYWTLYSDGACNVIKSTSTEMSLFVSDNLNVLSVNLPTIKYEL